MTIGLLIKLVAFHKKNRNIIDGCSLMFATSLSRFGGRLHVDSSEEGVVTSHAMVMIGEEVRIFAFLLSVSG